jgi:predicted component of type VI protein secretion system
MMDRLAMLVALALCSACESTPSIPSPKDLPVTPGSPKPTPAQAEVPTEAPTPYAVSRGNSVLWKRYAAFERDLMRGLELSRDEVCQELGDRNCVRDVHLIALGGNDPFGSGIHRPPPSTLGTTPMVVDRVLLSACSARAAADKQGPAKVFTSLELAGPPPAPGSAAAAATVETLFRRLLARDPKSTEAAHVQALLEPGEDAPRSAEEFAVLACFVVGSSLEFLFQ